MAERMMAKSKKIPDDTDDPRGMETTNDQTDRDDAPPAKKRRNAIKGAIKKVRGG